MSRKNLGIANTVRTSPARADSASRGKIEWRDSIISAEVNATPIAFTIEHIRAKPEVFVRKYVEWLMALQASKSLPSQAELACKHAMSSAFVRVDADKCSKALQHLDECNARWAKMRAFIVAALIECPNLGKCRLDGCRLPSGYATLFDALRGFGVIGSESIGQARAKVEASTASANAGK